MLCRLAANVAVTVAGPVMVHVLELELVELVDVQPDQPLKVNPLSGAAVRVTLVLKTAWHVPELVPEPVALQSIPPGELVTDPVPPPAVLITS